MDFYQTHNYNLLWLQQEKSNIEDNVSQPPGLEDALGFNVTVPYLETDSIDRCNTHVSSTQKIVPVFKEFPV